MKGLSLTVETGVKNKVKSVPDIVPFVKISDIRFKITIVNRSIGSILSDFFNGHYHAPSGITPPKYKVTPISNM